MEYGPRAFPEAAVAISDALNEYNARMSQLGHNQPTSPTDELGTGLTQGLATAINALPEMTEKKRYADAICTSCQSSSFYFSSRFLN